MFSCGLGSSCLGVSRWRPKVDMGGPCTHARPTRPVSRGNHEELLPDFRHPFKVEPVTGNPNFQGSTGHLVR